MLDSHHPRPLLLAAAGLTAALALAAPAGATEGPTATPIPPWNLAPPSFAPSASSPAGTSPSGSAPSSASVRRRPSIRSARIVPRAIRKGKRATLRLSLPQAGMLKYTITKKSRPHRGRVVTRRVSVPAGKVAIRLPRGVNGRALASGRYQVSVMVADTQGNRSRPVGRSLIVRSAHR